MNSETNRFLAERSDRIKNLHDKQERTLQDFDSESVRMGFRYVLF